MDRLDACVDLEVFRQIIELDDDDETHEFSKEMAWAFFSQAEATFVGMDKAMKAKELPKLASLGHFLKGSSAALGLAKVAASCERMQHYGQLRDDEANMNLNREEALSKIEALLSRVKLEYADAERWLKNYYADPKPLLPPNPDPPSPPPPPPTLRKSDSTRRTSAPPMSRSSTTGARKLEIVSI